MHVEADLLHGVLQLRESERQVLQGTNNGAIVGCIRSRRSIGSGELGFRVDRSGRGGAIKHPNVLKNIASVLVLMEEVVERAEVLDGELSAKTISELSKKSITTGCQNDVVNIEQQIGRIIALSIEK
jgi:hypothetical protein